MTLTMTTTNKKPVSVLTASQARNARRRRARQRTVVSRDPMEWSRADVIPRNVVRKLNRLRPRRPVQSGQALTSKVSNRPFSMLREAAPYHPVYGPGERFTYYYQGREIARTGATDAQSVGGTAPAANNEWSVMRVPKTSTGTYRYDSVALFYPAGLPSSGATYAAYESAFATSIESGTNYNDFNPILDNLKYYDQIAVRAISVDYDPSTAYTATGNLVVSADCDWGQAERASDARGYDAQSSARIRMKTKISEKGHLEVVAPTRSQLQAPSTTLIPISSTTDASAPIWAVRCAVDTTNALNVVDRIGSLSFRVVIDAYSFHWNAEYFNMSVGLRSHEQAAEQRLEALVSKLGIRLDDSKEVKRYVPLSQRIACFESYGEGEDEEREKPTMLVESCSTSSISADTAASISSSSKSAVMSSPKQDAKISASIKQSDAFVVVKKSENVRRAA